MLYNDVPRFDVQPDMEIQINFSKVKILMNLAFFLNIGVSLVNLELLFHISFYEDFVEESFTTANVFITHVCLS